MSVNTDVFWLEINGDLLERCWYVGFWLAGWVGGLSSCVCISCMGSSVFCSLFLIFSDFCSFVSSLSFRYIGECLFFFFFFFFF